MKRQNFLLLKFRILFEPQIFHYEKSRGKHENKNMSNSLWSPQSPHQLGEVVGAQVEPLEVLQSAEALRQGAEAIVPQL